MPKDIHKLAKKLNVPVIFTEEWEQRNKLHAKGNKLRAEGYKLRAEGDKLYAEGNKLYADKVIEEVGPKALIDWETGQVTF